jgi:hypothetical protein
MVDLDAALGEQFLNVAVEQPEPQIPAECDDDDVGVGPDAREGGPDDGSRTRATRSHGDSLAATSNPSHMDAGAEKGP